MDAGARRLSQGRFTGRGDILPDYQPRDGVSIVCEVIQASTDEALLRDVLKGDSYRTVGLR